MTEAGIAYQVRGGEGFFNRQEIKQALLALHRAAERGAEWRHCPTWSARSLEPLGLTAEEPVGTRARERWEALTALAELVDDEVAQRPQLELPGLVAELRIRADSRHPPVVQGVTLASLHAAKGLEWDAVFLVGLADGTLPISHALAHGPESERRRGGAPAVLRRNHQGTCAFGAQLGVVASSRRTSEPQAVAIPQRHRTADARRSGAEQVPAQPGRARPVAGYATTSLSTPAAVMLRRCETCAGRHRRGVVAATQGVAAAIPPRNRACPLMSCSATTP